LAQIEPGVKQVLLRVRSIVHQFNDPAEMDEFTYSVFSSSRAFIGQSPTCPPKKEALRRSSAAQKQTVRKNLSWVSCRF
jgi:hypothetical protein